MLLGETISPTIIDWLYKECGIKVFGVLGRYDEASVAQALKKNNGLLECKQASTNGVRLYGIGLSGCIPASPAGADILISSVPGLKYTCGPKGSDVVDAVAELIKPKMTIVGGIATPCRGELVFSPGSMRVGYLGLVRVTSSAIHVIPVNYDLLTLHLADNRPD